MSCHARTPGRDVPLKRPLATTAALVLAVTAGGLTAPAVAAGAAPGSVSATAAEANQERLLPLPAGEIAGAGATGYLVRDVTTDTYRWVRFDTGAVVELDGAYVPYLQGSDSVVGESQYGPTTVRDMTTGAIVLTVENTRLYRARALGAVGSTLLVTVTDDATGHESLHLFRPGANGTALRSVATGLPADATAVWSGATNGTSATLGYASGGKRYSASLDLASGTVTGARVVTIPADALFKDPGDASETLKAWLTQDASAEVRLVLQDRKTSESRSRLLGDAYRPSVHVVGDWALYADTLVPMEPSALQALRARSFSGTEFKLLDTFAAAVRQPDGTLLVQGGTLERGQGLFRIAAGADGKPVATMIASNGVPVKLALTSTAVPSVVDLDRNGGTANLDWKLSRLNVDAKVTLRHRRTGRTTTALLSPAYNDHADRDTARYRWDGAFDGTERAFNGAYDWQFTATPLDGLGSAVSASGSFTVTRRTNPRDLNDNGSPDLLVRDRSGTLIRLDTYHFPAEQRTSGNIAHTVGGGWQVYDRIETTGNLGGSAVGDLVATDRSGRLWLYRSTGSLSAPFATRRLIGAGGWQGYDRIAATGNIAGGPAGDLVARDRAGVLRLYLGKGDGTFAPPTRIGGGWQGYDDLIGSGDVDRDGRPDLYVADVEYGNPSPGFYGSTGAWQRPFRPVAGLSTVHFGRTFNLFA
ncbi:hypothetical protein SNE510_24580 [Streptomyces sp. NE5-10]|uniref:FG-GAP repeat domain-containing protein n=1 Tax=Streptomyces sp. NE5-10 TaxID=2759674 RepID=UPI001904CFC8|nr:VCBS repeat-containing protein [Streptomyces sp. NE5-10]GHJ92939.1 hypothetical protein SNE510_24580 [Streptomyces sp. NE5-10]